MSSPLFLSSRQEVINVFGSLSGSRQSQQGHDGNLEVRNLPFLPFIPVPQDTKHCNNEEDGEESRKPRKDAAVLVFSSVQGAEGSL